ncbi:MAG: hypothetical protein ACTSWA_05365 [Candidatus Thorarchaeota archaeon]
MQKPAIKVKFVHPFIKYEHEFNIDDVNNSLSRLMEIILEETKVHGRFKHRGRKRYDRLQGCIVMRGRSEVGHFNEDGFKRIDTCDDQLDPNEEIVVMIPITGG